MNKTTRILVCLTALALAAAPFTASARPHHNDAAGAVLAGLAVGLGWGIISSAAAEPQPTVVYQSAPVVYAQPAPVVYQPAPVVYPQPAPVVYQPSPVVYQPAPVVYQNVPQVIYTPPSQMVIYSEPTVIYDSGPIYYPRHNHFRPMPPPRYDPPHESHRSPPPHNFGPPPRPAPPRGEYPTQPHGNGLRRN